MKQYSILLIYQVCTTYAFDVLTLTVQPVLLLPYAAAYVNGYWQYGEFGNCIIFLFFCLNVTALIHAFIMQLLFRLASLCHENERLHKYTNLKKLFTLMFPVLFVCLSGITLAFTIDRPEGEIFRKKLISENPFFKELFQRHKNAMGYHPSFSGSIIVVFCIFVGFAFLTTPFNIYLIPAFYKKLKLFKQGLSEKNQRLHVMLLKALLAQGIALFIFVYIPLCILSSAFIYPYKSASILSSYSVFVVMQHTLCDILVQFWFIRPYRDYLIKNLRKKYVNQISSVNGQLSVQIPLAVHRAA
uniref:Serpentine Receptor, class H n=1 Tax=Panagrolaimus sp. PS1159 TaxID=55785 RepID=A0AC35GER3_9BILA